MLNKTSATPKELRKYGEILDEQPNLLNTICIVLNTKLTLVNFSYLSHLLRFHTKMSFSDIFYDCDLLQIDNLYIDAVLIVIVIEYAKLSATYPKNVSIALIHF